jgi:anti-anti-sigma factor
MNIQTAHEPAGAVVRLAGRLDGEAALQVSDTLERLLRDGERSVQLDLSEVIYLSSPGAQALQQAAQEYAASRAELRVISPSAEAREVLELTGLLGKLGVDAGEGTPERPPGGPGLDTTRDDWRVPTVAATRGTYELSTREPGAQLYARVHGRADAAVRGWIAPGDYLPVSFPEDAFGLGIGALGRTAAEAAPRLGEVVAAAGAVAHLPTDGAQVPDFDVGLGGRPPTAVLVSGIVLGGGHSLLARFSTGASSEAVPLAELAGVCLDGVGGPTAGMVIVAETTGLVGAWLRRSPGSAENEMHVSLQGVRDWLGTSPVPLHQGTTVLIAGVVSRRPDPALAPHLRPLAGEGMVRAFTVGTRELLGHFHAVVFDYRPVPQRTVALRALVTRLFAQQRVQGVLHLLSDDRGVAGAGESAFRRGLCWAGPVTQVATA